MARRGANRDAKTHSHVLWTKHIKWLKARADDEGRTESDILRRALDDVMEREQAAAAAPTEETAA